jgi:hypothetical protein
MSTIWTPSGERPVRREETSAPPPAAEQPPGGELNDEEVAAQMAAIQRELLEAPAALVVSNHCIGLFQLAAIHLQAERPKLEEAQLAIDALAAVVERLGSRLGAEERPLQDALTNLRLAYIEARNRVAGAG